MADSNVVVTNKKTPQILAGLSGTLGCLAAGTLFAWTAPALPSIENTRSFDLTESDKAWLGSLAMLGVFLSCPLTGYLVEKFGRQRAMLIFSFPLLIGWMQLTFASSILELKLGRIVTGFAAGTYFITCPMYISEICDKHLRGFFGICISIQCSLGVLLVYVVGTFLNWSWLSLVCSVVPLLIMVTMVFMPESPRYLLSVGRVTEASRNLSWLRGTPLTIDVDLELREIQESIELSRASIGTWQDLFKPETLKPTLICITIFLFQQSSGFNIVTMYSVTLFEDAGTGIDSNLASILLASGQVVAGVFSSVLIDRFGRRILLFTSGTIMAIGMFFVGLFFVLKQNGQAESIGWLPVVGLVTYMVSFSSGFGSIPPLLLGELLPPNTKGLTSTITSMVTWLTSFAIIEAYGPLKHVVGDAWSYWIFGIFVILGMLFVYCFLPETKGKTLEEIQQVFQSKVKPQQVAVVNT